MNTEILFTKSNKIGSYLIRKVTGEDVSHCALRIGCFVIHSSTFGVTIEPYEWFKKKNDIVYRVVDGKYSCEAFQRGIVENYNNPYDYLAMLYLGLKLLFPFLPKKNLWQSTGMFLCTEFVTNYKFGKEDSMITPKRLYLKLTNK